MRLLFIITILLNVMLLPAQEKIQFLGAGNSDGITVYTSSNFQRDGWNHVASGEKTISGEGLEGKLIEASRFLSQASLGADRELIKNVAKTGIKTWIDEQIKTEASLYLPTMDTVFQSVYDWFIENGGNPDDFPYRPYYSMFSYAWWELNMKSSDHLRHRIAFALSQIMVVSAQSELEGFGFALASYYDIFASNAFGNFRDILHEVALHPAMGYYLSHLNNPKADPENNIHPDENFAREIMQLFSIGLYELNPDGSIKIDGSGNGIPTYNNNDIKEFAKIFTGLGIGDVVENEWVDEPEFGHDIWIANMTVPMKMYNEWHEPGQKILLNNFIVPNGQDGMQDIEDAIDNLFNHENVGPFIGRRLIQMLVKSNPSPDYISSVTAAFNNNGEGDRGDMKAVIKAILLHPEARTCEWINNPLQGKLRESMMRNLHFAKAIGTISPSGRYWNNNYFYYEQTAQTPMYSPSVFNFYLPDFQPVGPIADAGLFAPEFQIHNSRTSIGYVNQVDWWAIDEVFHYAWESEDLWIYTDFTWLVESARDPEVLLNKLDLVLTHGQLSEETRASIIEVIEPLQGGLDALKNKIDLATYLIMISPDYAILK